MDTKINYKKLNKDCFWEYTFSEEDIDSLAHSDNFKEKQFLFEKILLNSTQFLFTLEVFERKDVRELIEAFKVPSFNHDFIFRRKNMAEVHFLAKPLLIDELKWEV